jgi:hypothetical protein
MAVTLLSPRVPTAPKTSRDLKELIAHRRRESAGLRHALVIYFDYAISGWRSWIVGHAAIFALENVCYWHKALCITGEKFSKSDRTLSTLKV